MRGKEGAAEKEKVSEGKVKEEEASTAPLPDKCQVGGSPVYIVEKKLGKGGFGQVFVGRRATISSSKEASASQYVALKFEHRSSKGCSYGPPYEWSVYRYIATDFQTVCNNLATFASDETMCCAARLEAFLAYQRCISRVVKGNTMSWSWTFWGPVYGTSGTPKDRSCHKRWSPA
ncbi:TPA: hypothetical protein ACH3X2_001240 [Trebouxia sp. C0005]